MVNGSSVFNKQEIPNDKKVYQLMNKDVLLLEFWEENSLKGKYGLKIGHSGLSNPFWLFKSESLESWLDNRAIPTNREHIDRLLESLNLNTKDRFNLLLTNHACSLNDTIWLRERNEKNIHGNLLTFNDVSLYRGFKESLGLITFFGNTSSLGGRIASPELTTQGMLRKAWRVIDGYTYLYKAGTYGYSNAGNENYSEVMACKIAEILGLNHIAYELVKWDNVQCCRCKLFTSEEVGYYPFKDLLISRKGGSVKWTYYDVVDLLHNDKNLVEQLNDMMVFDFIIENQDRHFGNFGLLVNNDNGSIINLAPLFDHGYSLLNFEMENDLKNFDFDKSSIGTFGISNRSQAIEIIKSNPKRYKSWAKTLMLHLDDVVVDGVPDFRVEAIQKLISNRCKFIERL